MASGRTVRQVKHGERLRRSQTSLNPVSAPDATYVQNSDVAKVIKTNSFVEVEGYGPYKPVPPPKPVHQSQQSYASKPLPQLPGSQTPPPYRMPPYPLYNEPTIPGTAGLDTPVSSSTPDNIHQGLHTHSSKFPIEREVILSNTDKNSKIPILHDYKKRTKGTIAPDVPPKQMAAWTQAQNHQILTADQTHPVHIQSPQPQGNSDGPVFRATYHPSAADFYNEQNSIPTGAIPRQAWLSNSGGDPSKPAPRPYPLDEYSNNNQTISQNNGDYNKESIQKDGGKTGKSMTKTYHTIKDIISSRFKSNKESPDEKIDDVGLNNVSEELRKSLRNIEEVKDSKKTVGEQGIYGKPRIDPTQSPSYNQHVIQQHLIAQQAQQQYQVNQHVKMQQHQQQSLYAQQQMAIARSHEMLSQVHRADDVYYQSPYVSTPSRSNGGGVGGRFAGQQQNYVQMQHHPQMISSKEHKEERRPVPLERRSAQQIERDQQRKSLEHCKSQSHPQLACNDDIKTEIPDNRPQPQIASNVTRRGSQGNLLIDTNSALDKDSDDGGFLQRNNSRERQLNDNNKHSVGGVEANGTHVSFTADSANDQQKDENGFNNKEKLTEALQGSPRKKLEGEIGKIEGVYNVRQRNNKNEEDPKTQKKNNVNSGASSDYDKQGQSSSNADSGRGSAVYSSGRRPGGIHLNSDSCEPELPTNIYRDIHSSAHDSEWVDIVENELRHILEPKLHELSLHGNSTGIANSTLSESISSMTPPLPPLSPGEQSSPNVTPRNSTRYKHTSLPYGSKPDYDAYAKAMKNHTGRDNGGSSRWHSNSSYKNRSPKKLDHNSILRGKQIFGLDTNDLTSTTTRSLDLESMLDGQTDSDGDISTADARTIRKQLEGLETMYSEVLKLLGVSKKYPGPGKYQPSDPRFNKRRYGSMSSLPSSSVSSRPIRDKRSRHDERKKVRDIRGINKRFQRLESHVVTLARSVAHLSSEMRTQHLMIQEMENIRGEIAALRTQTNMLSVRSQSVSRAVNSSKDLPSLANPSRVKKLTKFFGDEPPLLRLFLRKLGYEKYANVFENEKVGMVELPYLSEERLQKMGVPLGPRLRIMQEAQISVCKENTLCIV